MRAIPAAMATHLAGACTTLAVCLRLTLTDETVLGFTNHTRDLVIDGVTYQAETGILPSAMEATADAGTGNLEIGAIIDADVITDEDLLKGRYDYAQIAIFLVDYLDVAGGTVTLLSGRIGDVSVTGNQFTAEARSNLQLASQSATAVVSETCRVKLSREHCPTISRLETTSQRSQGAIDAWPPVETSSPTLSTFEASLPCPVSTISYRVL